MVLRTKIIKICFRNIFNFYIFVLTPPMISDCITDRYCDKGLLKWTSALSSEVYEENIQYCNDLKPANNHVSGEDQF
jgi:hypothetical protein